MSKIASVDELISDFVRLIKTSSRFRSAVFLSTLKAITPGWKPSGARTYLLLDRPGKPPVGITFRVLAAPGSPPQMCQWCHSVRTGDSVAMLSVSVSKDRRFGLYLCRDLSCRDKLHDTPAVGDLRDSIWTEECDQKLLNRMIDFVERNLV